MNYYKRHLGDYAKDTKHLSLAEHGAFTLLLDYYYATEKPIPDDRCERIANAYADSERVAVRTILREFFVESPEGWTNARADEVISEFHGKSLKAKQSADARWNKGVCERNANASETHAQSHNERNASHKPLASNHKKEDKSAAVAAVDFFPGIPPQLVADFVAHRKAKKAALTQTAVDGIKREADKAGYSMQQALQTCIERNWVGFKADWLQGGTAQPLGAPEWKSGGGRREL